jgi:hypothetical protein
VRRALALLPLALLLVAAPGCGSSDALDLDPVASAASKTSEAGSSRVSVQTTMNAAGEKMSFSGEGIFAYDEVLGSMTMDMSSLLPGEGDGTMEIRMLGSTMYMRMPEAFLGEAGLPEGKRWISFDLGEALDAAGMGALDPSELQQDPTQMLRLLRASSSEVKERGKVEVRGVETTRYTATLDLTKAVNATADDLGLSDQQREELGKAAKQLKQQAGVGKIPMEVFVDADGLLRRMLMKMSLAVEGERVSMEMLSDYYDFGVEVDVEAPPAAEVFDVSDEVSAGAKG